MAVCPPEGRDVKGSGIQTLSLAFPLTSCSPGGLRPRQSLPFIHVCSLSPEMSPSVVPLLHPPPLVLPPPFFSNPSAHSPRRARGLRRIVDEAICPFIFLFFYFCLTGVSGPSSSVSCAFGRYQGVVGALKASAWSHRRRLRFVEIKDVKGNNGHRSSEALS